MTQELALNVVDLAKSFGGVTALSGASLSVEQGTVAALIGPNGSGKSTTINLATGLYTPDRGKVYAFGEDITGARTDAVARRGVIRTFQTPRLFPTLTAVDNALAGAHLHARGNFLWQMVGGSQLGPRERALRADALELLDLVGLADQASSAAGALSTGSQKLLDLVRALMARPRVLLLDEPAAGLDDLESQELGALIAAARETGLTVAFVEHNMDLVLSVSDSIHVFHEGGIVFSGPPDEFRTDAAVSAAFLGVASDGQ